MKRPKVGVGIIVRNDNKVLVGKRKAKHGNLTWGFPGGHLEFMESIEACVVRELLEETSIKVKNIHFAALTNDFFKNPQKHYITIYMVCDYEQGDVKNVEPEKSEEWHWFAWKDLPRPLFLPIENLLAQKYDPFQE
ncbi:MAG: NUDIX hydrolase [Candidatus Daviesbacteria bacterium]|nr:NUDIX hydrolase [Candidatus Daviesbacteria bacterium]